MYDVIIVGGGPAGLTAGIYAKRAALETVLIEKGVLGFLLLGTYEKNIPIRSSWLRQMDALPPWPVPITWRL
jgi:thioredoxin reductase